MKKILLLLLLILSLSLFSSCAEEEKEGKVDIVCSVFPLYDWSRQCVGESDAFSLRLLVSNGTDMHSYQGSVQDLITLAECDLLITVGGVSDAWIEEALASNPNPRRRVLRLLDYIECEEGACHGDADHEHSHEAEGYDEHIWLSLKNAARLTRVIADAIIAADPENAALYEANAQEYIARIQALDRAYEEAVSASSQRILLFADRFPFVYLAKDYGITCFSAFSGCSAESEASAATVRALAEKIDLYGLKTVLVLEKSSDSVAASVISASKARDAQTLSVNSLQSIGASELADGVDYLSVMQENLALFALALQ